MGTVSHCGMSRGPMRVSGPVFEYSAAIPPLKPPKGARSACPRSGEGLAGRGACGAQAGARDSRRGHADLLRRSREPSRIGL